MTILIHVELQHATMETYHGNQETCGHVLNGENFSLISWIFVKPQNFNFATTLV